MSVLFVTLLLVVKTAAEDSGCICISRAQREAHVFPSGKDAPRGFDDFVAE